MAWAAAIPAAIGAVGSIAGGVLGSEGAGDAAKVQKRMYRQTREDLKPWRKTGKQALNELWKYIQNPELVTEMPGYEFAFGEGSKALLRSASATGNLASGATGKALTRYGQDYATTNWLNYLKPYQDLSAAGQNAATQTGVLGSAAAQGMSQNMLAGTGARVGAVGNVTNAITSGLKDYYYLNQMNKLSDMFNTNPNSNWQNSQANYLAMVR